MLKFDLKCLGACALTLSLADCGGGGSIASIPSPPITPTPSPTPAPPPVQATATTLPIIDNAPTGEFAVAGTASATIDPTKLPSFRYDASTDVYEVRSLSAWESLYSPAPKNEVASRTQAWTDSGVQLDIGRERTLTNGDTEWSHPYAYSTIVSGLGPDFGFAWLALGIPTPASGLPTNGSATFNGQIFGWSDYLVDDGFGDQIPTYVGGTVELKFDFDTSQLTGSMEPNMATDLYSGAVDSLGVFTFKDAVYSAGSYSGQFNSSVNGTNGFNGKLVGPHGEELIGGWALPYHYSIDGKDHQAFGAWIATH